MWMSVCGSAGRLTSGLHYKRRAQWGSTDLRNKEWLWFQRGARNTKQVEILKYPIHMAAGRVAPAKSKSDWFVCALFYHEGVRCTHT